MTGQTSRYSSGSSPRLRGTRAVIQVEPLQRRFIPASAGNTVVSHVSLLIMSVHPRVCGEHGGDVAVAQVEHGSSPRLRGTLILHRQFMVGVRFIPASAGNTVRHQPAQYQITVHPRVCGEHVSVFSFTTKIIGSSPRLRGTPKRHYTVGTVTRFIPASAGNTRSQGFVPGNRPVHPRVCGEHF